MKVKKAKTDNQAIEKDEVAELKNQLARSLADYDNLKKRVDAEKEIWFKVASARVVGKFLPIMDMVADALKHTNDQGLAIVLGEFRKSIIDEGFEEIPVEVGVTEFNSKDMEAIEALDGDEKQNNLVAEVVQSGWRAKKYEGGEDFVIRPAKVKVYKLKVEN